jgi:subtilisin family serine protease
LRLEDRVVPALVVAPASLALDNLEPTISSAIQREWAVDSQTQTSRWVIRLADGETVDSFTVNGATMTPVAGFPNAYVAEWPDQQSIAIQGEAIAGVGSADWFYPLVPRQQDPRFIPDDPLFNSQWHLFNTGQGGGTIGADVGATTAWDLTTLTGDPIRGDGVVVAIVDTGLQRTHPDFASNYVAAHSYDLNTNDSDPMPISTGYHGTAVAGVIGARGDNGIGVSGIAPNASLAGLRLIAGPTDDALEAAALGYHQQDIDIYNSSWGPKDGLAWLTSPGPLTQNAIENGVRSGRGGLGNIYVWAAGNGRTSADNINYDGYANSRYVIAVGAIDNNGKQAWYSEPGAPMLVTAYSGGDSLQVTTTDLMGSNGKNGLPDLNYTNSFTGTSASSPLVAGVVALLLQANPSLSYRDVMHILVGSARKNDPGDADWTTNGAGHAVNHKYGFGAVDAESAVLLAKQWTHVGPEISLDSGTIGVHQGIPDNGAVGITSSFNFTENLRVEHVEVEFNATHASRGQLEVILTSPSGTQSIMAQPHGDSAPNYSNWVFSSARHWDESSLGTWTLTVRDRVTGVIGTFADWSIRIYGAARGGPSIIDFETAELTYFENSSVPLTSTLAIDIPPAGLISGATITLVGGFQSDEDRLVFTDQIGISGSFIDNRLTLTGLRFKAEYEAAIRLILYENSSNNPSPITRRVAIQVTDSTGVDGSLAFRDIRVVSINDAPTFTAGPDVVRDEDAGPQSISAWATNLGAGVGEETQTLTFEVVSNSNPALFTSGPSVAADGTLSFETAANAFGTSTIEIRLRDNGGTESGGVDASNIQSFTIAINPVNDAPTAAPDSFVGTEELPFTIVPAILLHNDSDIEDSSLTIANLTQPSHGTMTLNADGSYLYTPVQDFFGVDQFTYTVGDGAAESDPTIGTITVRPVNDSPSATDDWVDVTSRPVRIAVLSNDVDVDLDVIRVLTYSRPSKGRLIRDGQALTFIPVAGAVGADSFSYTIADPRGATSTATVHLSLLDTTPPKLVAVRIWNGSKYINLAGSPRIILPWVNVHRIQFVFSEPVSIAANSAMLTGVVGGPIALSSTYDVASKTLTVSFDKLLRDRYSLRLSAAGVTDEAGNPMAANWARAFAILPGDFDGNGLVDNRDLFGVRQNYSAPGRLYAIFADIDGNGIVNFLDYEAVRQLRGSRI